jgi:hypothetical protein
MATQSSKLEKKLMDEKIAKVREVVRSVNTNDIILALHNYDLDVERTIQAFCEVGAKGALGEWEQSKVTSKKNKQKNKPQVNGGVKASTASSTPLSQAALPTSNGATKLQSNAYSFSSSSDIVNEAINGYTNGYLDNNSKPAPKNKSGAATSSSSAKPKPPLNAGQQNGTSSRLVEVLSQNEQEQKKVLSRELTGLQAHHKELDNAHNKFDKELVVAQSNITQCFQELRQALMERERQLHDELMHCRHAGETHFNGRRNEVRRLQQNSDRINSLKENEVRHLIEELQSFGARKAYDTEVGHATRFVYDNSKLIRAITQFGEIVPVKVGQFGETASVHAADIKHSTSHSSLVSSVGEDSGLGQVSPVAQVKSVAQVETVASNSLSETELADIHRRMEELLKQQGIDPSVLDTISSNSAAAPRRRPPPPKRDSQKSNTANNSDNKPKPNNNNNKNKPKKVELSIMK